MKKNKPICVIDLFAGPGGLGEGFSSFESGGLRQFKIGLSIEKDQFAHKTLLLRAFTRQFDGGKIPKEYYWALEGTTIDIREKRFKELFDKYSEEYSAATEEAWHATLGGKDFPEEKVDERITAAIGQNKNWLLIGGPPCQAYSLVGRSRNKGISKNDHRVYLYKEYLRIIAKHQPAVFVMENVKGLLSAKLDGKSVFNKICEDLRTPASVFSQYQSEEYKIFSFVSQPSSFDQNGFPIYDDKRDFIIKSENYGIPQKRHRVILLGVRANLNISKEINLLIPKNQASVESVISDLPKIRSGIGRKILSESILPNGKKKRNYQKIDDTDENWSQAIKIMSKSIFSLNGFKKKGVDLELIDLKYGKGAEYLKFKPKVKNRALQKWYKDSNLTGINNHKSRSHLYQDLKRYLFATIYTRAYQKFPRMEDYKKYSKDLLPDHKNALSGKFNDRFRVQVGSQPATTITSHISKDGHYFIHFDQNQCRSFTVREAARIQTFPDNYLFRGPRTAQFHQVGNAVPPFLANQLAKIVFKIFNPNGKII